MQNSIKCHFNRPGKTRIRSVKGILALFCDNLIVGQFHFMGVSTTHPILSMRIYAFDTYYVWAACGNPHILDTLTKLQQTDFEIFKNSK